MSGAETPLRGRDNEIASIHASLVAAKGGHGSMIVVEGDAGCGKTRLLAQAVTIGSSLGFRTGRAAGLQGHDPGTFATLGAAMLDAGIALGDAADDIALTERLHSILPRCAQESPLLLCVDDAHWADGGTVGALRVLPSLLSDAPIVWLIVVQPREMTCGVASLVQEVTVRGADLLTLDALDDDASTRVVADIAGGEPTTELSEFARGAGGNPALLSALVHGLVDEGSIRVAAGAAELVAPRVPRVVLAATRRQLAYVSATARRAASVCALLGERTAFDHVATVLRLPAASVLAPIDELVGIGLVTHTGDGIAFPQALIRRAISDLVPHSARAALQRDAIDALLADDLSPVEPAAGLAQSAEFGDRRSVQALAAAARAVATTDMAAAADLSLRSLELTRTDDAARGERVAEVALLLHEAGRADDARLIAEHGLLGEHTAEAEAEIRLSLARMSGLSPAERVATGEAALALTCISPPLRARHLAQLADNLVAGGWRAATATLLESCDEERVGSDDRDASPSFAMARSRLSFSTGDLRDALAWIDRARAQRLPRAWDGWVVDRWRAEVLLALDEFDGSQRIGLDRATGAQHRRHAVVECSWHAFLGGALLQAGRLDDAVRVLDRVVVPEAAPAGNVTAAATLAARGRLAIHLGDNRAAQQLAAHAEHALASDSVEIRRHAAWFLAQYALVHGDEASARAHLDALRATAEPFPLPIPSDVTDDARLVRAALQVGDTELAEMAVNAAAERERRNPGILSIAATAAHARGLLEREVASLTEAAELFAQTPRVLALASAREDCGVELVRAKDRELAVSELGESLQLYVTAGATWDAARVRRRLRALGIRRRIVTPSRSSNGWAGLTGSELAVAKLVAEGLTNRRVADRLFVSPHTVSMHLRRAFTKLGINTRVELTRLALMQEEAA